MDLSNTTVYYTVKPFEVTIDRARYIYELFGTLRLWFGPYGEVAVQDSQTIAAASPNEQAAS